MKTLDETTPLFERFTVTLEFRNQLRGGIPKNPDVIKAWLNARISQHHRIDELAKETRIAMGEADLTPEQIEQIKDGVWNGFKRDGRGLYYEGRCCKAALKESASVIRQILGITALKSKVAERFFVVEDRIYLGRTEEDGSEENFVHAMTPQGPISALKRSDYVQRATITFSVDAAKLPWELAKKGPDGERGRMTNEEVLTYILRYAERLGMGADRSQGHGQFSLLSIMREDRVALSTAAA